MSLIECSGISKSFAGEDVLQDVSFTLEHGRRYALMGKSGAGKSTLARILSGLERPSSGKLVKAKDTNIILVPQDFAIWPHLSVYENVAFGSRQRGQKCKEAVATMLEACELKQYYNTRAGSLSYGEKQRVALARALVHEPDVIILDEPFAHMDPVLKRKAWRMCLSLFERTHTTSVWITHSPEEALPMAEQILILEQGRLLQVGSPEAIYNEPISVEVAAFCGDINCFSAEESEQLKAYFKAPMHLEAGKHYGVRPHALHFVEDEQGQIQVKDMLREFVGAGYIYHVFYGKHCTLRVFSPLALPEAGRYSLTLDSELWMF